MNCAVSEIKIKGDSVNHIILANGEEVTAKHYISTCGGLETEKLCKENPQNYEFEEGRFTIIESMAVFEGSPLQFGWEDTVLFFNEDENFNYNEPENPVDLKSGVICLPENYGAKNSDKTLDESKIRITHPANFKAWTSLTKEEYQLLKIEWEDKILENGLRFLPSGTEQTESFQKKILLRDTFTPKTIRRFTSHQNGTLYGSPTKSRDGSTSLKTFYSRNGSRLHWNCRSNARRYRSSQQSNSA